MHVDPNYLGCPSLKSQAQDGIAVCTTCGHRPNTQPFMLGHLQCQFECAPITGRQPAMGVMRDDTGQRIGGRPQIDPLEKYCNIRTGSHATNSA
jgi:hypothetical protein